MTEKLFLHIPARPHCQVEYFMLALKQTLHCSSKLTCYSVSIECCRQMDCRVFFQISFLQRKHMKMCLVFIVCVAVKNSATIGHIFPRYGKIQED